MDELCRIDESSPTDLIKIVPNFGLPWAVTEGEDGRIDPLNWGGQPVAIRSVSSRPVVTHWFRATVSFFRFDVTLRLSIVHDPVGCLD